MDRVDLALLGDCDKVIEWIKNQLAGTSTGALSLRGCSDILKPDAVVSQIRKGLSRSKYSMRLHMFGLWMERI